ncbi:MAG: single-stranded DNA-binding protein, partial [Crocosphaera sp.]
MTTLNINQINLVGRLGKDPEIRFFDSGKILAKLTLAVKRPSS